MSKRLPTYRVALFAILFAIAGLLLILNFSAGEKKVDQQLPRLYSASDPQFMRAMGSFLGPGIIGGNRIQELLSGDQIFPSML
jgi:cardiolipin synthase A/B